MPSQLFSCSWAALFQMTWEAWRLVPAFPSQFFRQTLLGCTCMTILAREEPAVDIHNTLLSSLFTSSLSSCCVCLQTSKLICKCRHSCGLITMTNIASWLLYAPLSPSICCCFAYQSINVNQGISSSLLHPACIGGPSPCLLLLRAMTASKITPFPRDRATHVLLVQGSFLL